MNQYQGYQYLYFFLPFLCLFLSQHDVSKDCKKIQYLLCFKNFNMYFLLELIEFVLETSEACKNHFPLILHQKEPRADKH